MAVSPRYEKLDLDPGTVPTRKRQTSGCKCMLLAVGILISLLVSIGIAKFVSSIFYGLREPHSFLYENKTLAEVKNMSTVVRPLVDRDQKFDIVATVWVRTLDPPDNASEQYDWMHGEDHIFSDTVFRGVTLKDVHVHTKVNLSIPLETFSKAETLENFDIRATFKLVPQSPSLFDHITNFTSWVPATVVLPDISPETHARRLKGDLSPPETLKDLQNAALESFAISAPLIDLHPIKSACGRKTEEEEDDQREFRAAALVLSTKGKPPLKVHPHVVTRTDLRVVRMDKIYNKKAYDAHHKQLRRNTDMIPMPVDREHCPEGSVPETPQSMQVTWNLAYSGSTAEKLLLAEAFGATNTYNTTDTEINKLKDQQHVDFMQRIHGHKHSADNHVGRVFMFDAIAEILNFIRINLQFHYWYTRSTTVGISIIGSSLTALSFSLLFALKLWNEKAFREGEPLLSSLFALVMAVYWYLLISGAILRAVLRLEGTDAFPYVTLVPASHLERASARLETKGRRRWIIGILVGVFSFYFIDALRNFPLISRIGPAPDPVAAELVIPNAISDYLGDPLYICGTVFQVILKYRSKTFAGGYKLVAWMHLVSYLISLMAYIPRLAWRAGAMRDPFLLEEVVTMGLLIVLVVQGVLYKRVEQDIEDKDTS